MASSKDNSSAFRLVPFMQNKADSVSFFLAPPYQGMPVMHFLVDLNDYASPEAFYDILTTFVEAMPQGKPPAGGDS